jgi:hypothetical protein
MEIHIFFLLLVMKLSWSHDQDRWFNMIARLTLIVFFIIFFNPSTLSWLKIELHNYFFLIYTELSQSYDPSRGFNRLTLVDLDIFFLI